MKKKRLLDFVYFHFGKSASFSVGDLPIFKIQKYFPEKSLDTVIFKWQVDLWPRVYDKMLNTSDWDSKDTEYLLIKIALQKPRDHSEIDFTKISKMWDSKTLQFQFNAILKTIAAAYVLPLQVVLSQLLNKYHLNLSLIEATKKKDDFKSW